MFGMSVSDAVDGSSNGTRVPRVDAHGKVIVRRQLKRRYVLAFFKKLSPCLVGIEACATSHHWSRSCRHSVTRSA